MGRVVAKSGAVNGASNVRHIEINDYIDEVVYADSSTDGAVGRIDGNTDWDGWYGSYGHTPASWPGEAAAIQASIDGTDGCAGTAIVDVIRIDIAVEEATPISHVVRFSGDGTLTHGAQAISDTSVSCRSPSKGMKVSLGTVTAAPVWSDVTNIRDIQFTVACQNPKAVDSSSNGVTVRDAGNVDASLVYKVYTDNLTNLPTRNATKAVRIYVTSTGYYEVFWMKCTAIRPIEAPIEKAGFVAAEVMWGLESVTSVDGTCTKGHIYKRGNNQWWPT